MSRAPAPTLVRDFYRAYAPHAARCFAETGSPIAAMHHLKTVDGWLYARAATLEGNEQDELKRRHAAHCAELHRTGTSFYESVARPEIESLLTTLRRRRPRGTALAAAVTYLELAMESYAYVFGDLHWRLFASDDWDWAAEFAETTGEAKEQSAVLLQGLEHATAKMVRELRALARVQQAGDEDALQRELQRFLRRHGRRTGSGYGSSIQPDSPSWSMQPELVLDVVRAYAKQDLDELDAVERSAKRERDDALRRLRRKLRDDPERLARFEDAYRRARQETLDMENSNALIEQELIGTYREAVDLAGRALVHAGLADHPDDVFHLSLDELRSLSANGRGVDVRRLVADRKAELEAQATAPRPAAMLGGEAPERGEEEAPALPADGVVRGTGISTGTATGRAVVALPSPAPPDVEPGDVLVCNDLGPAWTPIVPLLAGMVLDHGGIYQHAAIVAREYGIPAVLETKVATKVIPDGATVTVDAAAGTVAVAVSSEA